MHIFNRHMRTHGLLACTHKIAKLKGTEEKERERRNACQRVSLSEGSRKFTEFRRGFCCKRVERELAASKNVRVFCYTSGSWVNNKALIARFVQIF